VNAVGAPILGVVADDFTGATDVAGMLVNAGMRTVQVIGVPDGPPPAAAAAVVVALKSRTTPAVDAVRKSLAALRWLQRSGFLTRADRGEPRRVQKDMRTLRATCTSVGPLADAGRVQGTVPTRKACPRSPRRAALQRSCGDPHPAPLPQASLPAPHSERPLMQGRRSRERQPLQVGSNIFRSADVAFHLHLHCRSRPWRPPFLTTAHHRPQKLSWLWHRQPSLSRGTGTSHFQTHHAEIAGSADLRRPAG